MRTRFGGAAELWRRMLRVGIPIALIVLVLCAGNGVAGEAKSQMTVSLFVIGTSSISLQTAQTSPTGDNNSSVSPVDRSRDRSRVCASIGVSCSTSAPLRLSSTDRDEVHMCKPDSNESSAVQHCFPRGRAIQSGAAVTIEY